MRTMIKQHTAKAISISLVALLLMMVPSSNVWAKRQPVYNSDYCTPNCINSDGTLYNSNYHIIGYVMDNGTVKNSDYHTIGHVMDDGTVKDSDYHTVGYAKNLDKNKAAAILFFFGVLN